MKKIIPHLWFDTQAVEAANFYTSVFPNSRVTHTSKLTGTPSGDCDIVSFEVMGTPFEAISAGPYFKINPSISFVVNFDPSQSADAAEKLDEAWLKLSEGGLVRMPLGEYPFSKRYGWIEDRYGVSWQLILTNPEGEQRPPILPALMFTKDVSGKAEEAINFYLSVFKNTQRGLISYYPEGVRPDPESSVMFSDFKLEDTWFVAMDGGKTMHDFTFNEGVSLLVKCDTQEEIDYYWEKLSAVPEAEQCGWLKDKYGVSWQITPTMIEEIMQSGDQEKINRVTQAFLKMKKFDIAELETAAEGK